MPPRKTNRGNEPETKDTNTDDTQHFATIIEELTERMKKFEEDMKKKDRRIENQEQEISNLKRRLSTLEDQADDADVTERQNSVVVSGNGIPESIANENLIDIACKIAKQDLKVNLDPKEITTAHRIGRKPTSPSTDKRPILIKLHNKELKTDLITASKKVRPDSIFINENLSPIRSTILYALKEAKRKFPNTLAGCGFYNGKVFVHVRPPNPSAPNARNSKVSINTRARLDEFIRKSFDTTTSALIDG